MMIQFVRHPVLEGKKMSHVSECPIDQVLFSAVISEMDRVMFLLHPPLLLLLFGPHIVETGERHAAFVRGKGKFFPAASPAGLFKNNTLDLCS